MVIAVVSDLYSDYLCVVEKKSLYVVGKKGEGKGKEKGEENRKRTRAGEEEEGEVERKER